MTTCEYPFHGRRRRHYDWCPLRASNRRAATPKCVECGLMTPKPLHERIADDMRALVNDQKPEGVSVLVVEIVPLSEGDLQIVARMIAGATYPDCTFTGRVLHVGRDALGAGRHEVVLEVA